MMCTGATKVCGYGVQIDHIRHFIDPDKLLYRLLRARGDERFVLPGEEWLLLYSRAEREMKLRMLEDGCLPMHGGLAGVIASDVKAGDVAWLGDTPEKSILLHLPQYPWAQSLINASESCEAIYNALAPFLLSGVDGEAIRELTDYIEDAEEFGGVFI